MHGGDVQGAVVEQRVIFTGERILMDTITAEVTVKVLKYAYKHVKGFKVCV